MLTNFRNLASHEGAQSYTRMHSNLSAQNGKFDKFILEYLTTPQSIIFAIRGNSDEHLFSPYNTFT